MIFRNVLHATDSMEAQQQPSSRISRCRYDCSIHQTSTIPYLSRLWCGWSWALSSVSPSAGIMIAPLCSCPATPSYHSLRPPARAGNEPRESRSLRGLLQVVSPYLHFHIKDTRYYLTIKTLLR